MKRLLSFSLALLFLSLLIPSTAFASAQPYTPKVLTSVGATRVRNAVDAIRARPDVQSVVGSGYRYYSTVVQPKNLGNLNANGRVTMYFSKTANLGVSQDHYSIQAAFNAGATTPTSINAIQTSGPYFKFVPIIYPASGGMTVWNSPFAIPIPSAADPGHIVADASISDVKKYRRLSPQQQAFVYMTAPPPLPAFTASFSPNTISITR